MKKSLLSLILCVCMLLSVATPGISATAAGDTLPYTTAYGTTDGATLSKLTALSTDVAAAFQNGTYAVTVDSTTGIPFQIFNVDTGDVTGDSITLSLTAQTIENERLALKVLNVTTNQWDVVATAVTEGQLTATVDLATYSADGTLQAMSTVDYVSNGSNRMLWSTDQQHYTEFTDLNAVYMQIHEYMAQEYAAGDVAYVINTGDIVDDPPSYSTSIGQWMVADEAFSILDEAGVPYGIETGNHDVGDFPINNYTNYLRYFGEERYQDNAWYGGTNDDNRCHYDLVTVGNVDLLMLYIGYGLEADTEVLNWASDVIDMYPHRSVILCTHQYLKPTDLSHAGRADILYDNLVSRYENIVMVLSGHYDGAGYKTQILDDGRIVQEVISDYQFVQVEDEEYYADAPDPTHSIGSVPNCNGEGYIREILISGNTVSMYTFSPVTGGTTPFGALDDITLEVQFAAAQRSVTTHAFSASVTDVAAGDFLNETHTVYANGNDLQTLIDIASDLKKSEYTADSYSVMKDALKAAKTAVKGGNNDDIVTAFTALQNALGALQIQEDVMDRDKLTTVADLNLNLALWENGNGLPGLDKASSYIDAEQLDNGGFVAQASIYSPNSWPSLEYTEAITFTPEDGKVYLYLDLEAGSTWSCYPIVIQDKQQYYARWNYAIDGSYDLLRDAGSGIYYGVYDVTQALIDMGVDVTQEMTLCFAMNVVPGPITVNAISVLTGEYPTGFSLSDNWTWILLIAVILLAVVAILFAVLYKPKKAGTTDASDIAAHADAVADVSKTTDTASCEIPTE